MPQSLINRYRYAGAAYRSLDGAETVWRTIPESIRREGPDALNRFHSDKDWSHIIPRSAGGNDLANNGIFEKAALNRARGAATMTSTEIQTARQALNSEALRSAIRQTVGLTLVGALVPAVVETIFAVLEYGLDYQERKITEKELYLSVGKRFMTTAATAVVVSGVIAGLVMIFPVFLPTLSVLTIPAAAASFLLLGIRFYRLGREWLTRMGVDPTVEVWNRSKAISDWTWRATTGALGRASVGCNTRPLRSGMGCNAGLLRPDLGCYLWRFGADVGYNTRCIPSGLGCDARHLWPNMGCNTRRVRADLGECHRVVRPGVGYDTRCFRPGVG